jgi:hypothetical protein
MLPKPSRLTLVAVLASSFALSSHTSGGEARPVYSRLTAHEWGTFTSIAGAEGQAVEWSPLTGSTDLPGFVEHFRNTDFKRGLRGTVRMETPVIYFYDSKEETVSVKVAFAKGLITEWYPRASRVEPAATVLDSAPHKSHPDGSIAWDSVIVSPSLRAEFPHEDADNHYYAARMTSSTPLRVLTHAGEQREKFLFYRGVSNFPVPISTRLTSNGKVLIENHTADEFPNVILFERRGEKMGYRIAGALQKEMILDEPKLTTSINDLARDLEGILVAQGLYQDEAHAMVETWRNSWFEEGSRLFYIVPVSFVDRVLPLSINPAPALTVRAFVGRLEILSPSTQTAVERALLTGDNTTLKMYGRFLEPIMESLVQKESDPARVQQLYHALTAFQVSEASQNGTKN